MKTLTASVIMLVALWVGVTISEELNGPNAQEIASRFQYAGKVRLTHYVYGKVTSSGAKACSSIVAVDPALFAEGTILYIEGVGFRWCGDKGGLVKGRRVDLRGHHVDPPDSVNVWVVFDPPKKK